jgi:TP901 family phage tail tape measure protein
VAVQVASLFASVGADLSGLNKGLGKAQLALGTFAGNMMTGVVNVLAKAGQALVGLGTEAVNLAADFEKQMAILSIAASSSGMTFDELHDAAIAVGGDVRLLGVSATGAGDAMTGLYKAGLTTTEIFGDLNAYMNEGAELGGALRAAIDLAAATELDMVQASDLAAVALATFGGELETEEERAQFVNEAMNNMVKAADASVAEVSDLAAAMANIGPTAAAFGFKFEDVNNALAILSTRGIAGAEAGTALKSMLTNIMRPTDDVQEALNNLGISLYDAEGNMKSLPQIIGMFEKAMSGLTEEERNTYTQMLAGTYGMKAMNTLMAEGVEGWDAMALATQNAAGIQEQAAAQAATFSGQMEALDGTLETLKITLGEALLPYLTQFASWAGEWVSQNGPQLAASFGELVGWLAENLPTAIATVIAVWNEVLVPAFQGLVDLLGKNGLIAALVALAAVLLAPLIPIALLGAALVALGLLWNQYGEQVRLILEQLGVIIAYGLNEASTTLTTWFTDGLAQWKANWEMFQIIVGTVWNNIKTSVENAVNAIKGFIQGVIDKIRSVAIPDWLQGHSPPPMADWFNDIADAMDNAANAKLPKLNAAIGVSHMVATSPMAGGASMAGGGGMVININGPLTVRDDRDIDMLADRLAKRLQLRGGNRGAAYKAGT